MVMSTCEGGIFYGEFQVMTRDSRGLLLTGLLLAVLGALTMSSTQSASATRSQQEFPSPSSQGHSHHSPPPSNTFGSAAGPLVGQAGVKEPRVAGPVHHVRLAEFMELATRAGPVLSPQFSRQRSQGQSPVCCGWGEQTSLRPRAGARALGHGVGNFRMNMAALAQGVSVEVARTVSTPAAAVVTKGASKRHPGVPVVGEEGPKDGTNFGEGRQDGDAAEAQPRMYTTGVPTLHIPG